MTTSPTPLATPNPRDCPKCGLSARGGPHYCEKDKPVPAPLAARVKELEEMRAKYEYSPSGTIVEELAIEILKEYDLLVKKLVEALEELRRGYDTKVIGSMYLTK